MKIKRFALILLVSGCVVFDLCSQEFSLTNCSYGIKVKNKAVEFRYFQKDDDRNYGFSFVTDSIWKKNPCQLKIGNMISGGTWSLMKSPALDFSYSPFFVSKSGVQNLTATLCSTNSFPEQISCFVQAGVRDNRKLLSELALNCWCNPEDKVYAGSVLMKVNFSRKYSMGISFTCGKLNYEKNNFSSWFNQKGYFFNEGELFCGAGQLSFTAPWFRTMLFTAFYTSPEGLLKPVYRSENQIRAGRFIFSLSAFYNPWNNLLLPDESIIHREVNLRSGIVYSHRLKFKKPVILKAGTNCYTKWNFIDSEYPLKIAGGFQVTDSFISYTFASITSLNVPIEYTMAGVKLDSQKFSFYTHFYFPSVTTGVSCDWTVSHFSEGVSFIQKYGVTVTAGKKIRGNGAVSWEQCIKNGEVSSSSTAASVNLQWQAGWVIVNGKMGIKIDM